MVNVDFGGDVASDEFDRRLQAIAQQAQDNPLQSTERQQALNQLVDEIMRSNQLGHPQRGNWPDNVYRDLYDEAVSRTVLKIYKKIDRYNSEHPVMAWANNMLRYEFLDVVREYQNQNRRNVSIPSLEEININSDRTETVEDDAELLRQFLADDPENLLQTAHIRGRPDVTFQSIAWAKYVEDQTWESISQTTGIPVSTLANFFDRNLRKFQPYFEQYLQD